MARYPLFGVNQKGKSTVYSAQRRVNLFAEYKQEGDRSQLAWYGTPGLTIFTNFGDNPVRGLHAVGDRLFAVHGGTFYEIDNVGNRTIRGSIGSTTGRVFMEDNGLQVMVADELNNGYIFTLATNVFTQITDPDFPGARSIAFQGQYFVINKPDTGQFFISALANGLSWDALDFATAESFPDDLVAVFEDHGEIILLGEESLEIWANIGAQDFPFQRISGAVVEWGLAARSSLVKYTNTLAFLAKNRTGEVQAVQLIGYQPTRLSNEEVEYIWSNYGDISNATGLAYISAGHPFYQVNFPTVGKSWLYDGQTGLWSELEYGSLKGRHRANIAVQYNNRTVASDYQNGKVYTLDVDVYTDDGEEIQRELVGRHVFDEDPISIGRLWLDIETGVGLASGQGSDPQAMLTISKDGGRTFGPEKFTDIGEIGKYGTRAIWRRLGRAYDWTIRVRISDPIKVAISGAWVDAL